MLQEHVNFAKPIQEAKRVQVNRPIAHGLVVDPLNVAHSPRTWMRTCAAAGIEATVVMPVVREE
eukprot:6173298-Prymnesium_polylepis.1